MMTRFPHAILITVSLGALTACAPSQLDWDLRGLAGGQLDTRDAALQATANRPRADARGVLSYPGYQVAVAQRGDTVRTVATRLGLDANELGRTNAIKPDDPLREGEVLALPRRVASDATPFGTTESGGGAIASGTIAPAQIDVTTLAGAAIDRSATSSTPTAAANPAVQPGRHRVQRGETAYSIARLYGVSARALADWNALGPDLTVREGQYLLIPTPAAGAAPRATSEPATVPGAGTPTPVPPSATKPLPDEKTEPAASKPSGIPKSPDLGQSRTAASGSTFGMPVQGRIIRGYAKGKNEGIDIAATAGTTVVAAADGTVAAITKDTDQVPILVIRHDGNLLSVYAGIDAVKVSKGAKVKRGQPIAVIRKADPAFLHFEVRKGVDSIDPVTLLQ